MCTFLSIPNETVEKQFEQHNGNVDETLFSLLCMWCGGKGATWGALLQALRAAKLNAQANRLLEWGESGGASVSFIYGGEGERCMYWVLQQYKRAVNAG